MVGINAEIPIKIKDFSYLFPFLINKKHPIGTKKIIYGIWDHAKNFNMLIIPSVTNEFFWNWFSFESFEICSIPPVILELNPSCPIFSDRIIDTGSKIDVIINTIINKCKNVFLDIPERNKNIIKNIGNKNSPSARMIVAKDIVANEMYWM